MGSEKEDKGIITVRYTTKDIIDHLHKQDSKLDSIETQTKLTNGRVTAVEKQIKCVEESSIGIWISRHPFRFALIVLFVSLMLLGIRNFPKVFEWITAMFI